MAFIHPMYSLGKNKHDKYVKFHNQVNCHKTSSSPNKDLAAHFRERWPFSELGLELLGRGKTTACRQMKKRTHKNVIAQDPIFAGDRNTALYKASVITRQSKTKRLLPKRRPRSLLPRPSPSLLRLLLWWGRSSGSPPWRSSLPIAGWSRSQRLDDEEQVVPGDDLLCTDLASPLLAPLHPARGACCFPRRLLLSCFSSRFRTADVLSPTCAFLLPLMTFFLCKQ